MNDAEFREHVCESLGNIQARLDTLTGNCSRDLDTHDNLYKEIGNLGNRMTRVEVWAVGRPDLDPVELPDRVSSHRHRRTLG